MDKTKTCILLVDTVGFQFIAKSFSLITPADIVFSTSTQKAIIQSGEFNLVGWEDSLSRMAIINMDNPEM